MRNTFPFYKPNQQQQYNQQGQVFISIINRDGEIKTKDIINKKIWEAIIQSHRFHLILKIQHKLLQMDKSIQDNLER